MDVENKVIYTLAGKDGGGEGQDGRVICSDKLFHVQWLKAYTAESRAGARDSER